MKFLTEKDSIDYFVKRLEKSGYTNINPTQASNKFCYYDISAEKNGTIFRFELKRRNYPSTRFGDSICEKWKYDNFIEGIRKGEFHKGILVSLFEDCFTMDDITKPYDVDFIYANKTTEFANRNIVEKTMVHYNQAKKINY